MEQIIGRYLAGEAILRLAKEFNMPYGTLRQRLTKIAPPFRKQGQHIAQTDEHRFMALVIPEPMSGCWLWMGAHHNTKYEYGVFTLNGKQTTAHRAAWLLLRGHIPDGFEIDHKCRNKTCVNPDHLQPITKAENLASRILVKTHCARGHLFSDDNLMFETVNGKQVRRCRTCRQKWSS